MKKLYTAFVRDKMTKKYTLITSEYNTQADFVSDIKANGYSVIFIASADKFDERFEEYNEMKSRGFHSVKKYREWYGID